LAERAGLPAVIPNGEGFKPFSWLVRCRSLHLFFIRIAQARRLAILLKNKIPAEAGSHKNGLAERAGFEPAIPFRVYTLSRRAPSTTRTPLQVSRKRAQINQEFTVFPNSESYPARWNSRFLYSTSFLVPVISLECWLQMFLIDVTGSSVNPLRG
jgi:hypothetical protein